MLFNKNIYKFFKPEIELSSPHRSARNDKLDAKSVRCMKYEATKNIAPPPECCSIAFYRPAFRLITLTIRRYSFKLLGGER